MLSSPAPIPRITTLCLLAHAGGCAQRYLPLLPQLAQAIRLVPIELPGHGEHLSERPLETLEAMTDYIAERIPEAAPQEIAIFGHSMGGMLAYLTAKHFADHGETNKVGRLILSCCHVPGYTRLPRDILGMDLKTFRRTADRHPGIPREVLASPELSDLFLPPLHTDFKAILREPRQTLTPLPIPIDLIAATEDNYPIEEQLVWRGATTERFRIRRIPGEHFYLTDRPGLLERTLFRILDLPGRPQ